MNTTKPTDPQYGDTYQDAETKKTYFWSYTTWLECHRVALHSDQDALAAVTWLAAQGVTRITLTDPFQPIPAQSSPASPAILFQNVPPGHLYAAFPGDFLLESQGGLRFGVEVVTLPERT